jgi:hypothetical protein
LNVLYVAMARAIRLFDFSTMNPAGRDIAETLGRIAIRYKFGKFPQNIADVEEKKGWWFRGGGFTSPRGVRVLVTVTLYTDGFVADTMSTTDDSSAFLDDLIKWMVEEEGLTAPIAPKNGFLTQLVFQSKAPLVAVNPRLADFAKRIAQASQPADGISRQFDVGAINFWTEDSTQLGAPAHFKIERKFTVPFSEDTYYSQAPMETAKHIALLTEFETMFPHMAVHND